MLSSFDRWVTIFELWIKPNNPASPNISIRDIIFRLEDLYLNDKAVKLYSNETRAFRISDFKYDEYQETLTLLIQLSDKNATDPAFADLQTGSLRVEPKLAGEGVAVSCHLMIKTSSIERKADRYLAMLESVPGISQSALTPFLNFLLKTSFDGQEFKNPATGSMCKLFPKAKFLHHASKTLKELLKGSRLQGIRLINTSIANEMDKNRYTRPIEKAVKLKVVKQPGANEKISFLQEVKAKWSAEGFNKFFISFSKDGKQDSVELDRNEDAATKLFAKSERVCLADEIGQCEKRIHEEMYRHLSALMVKENKQNP